MDPASTRPLIESRMDNRRGDPHREALFSSTPSGKRPDFPDHSSVTAMKVILAATDFSAPARHAAERAARLAHEMHASLTLIHVLPGPVRSQWRSWLGATRAKEQPLSSDVAGQLRHLAEELVETQHLAVSTHESFGSVLDEITTQADALDAGLIVVGAPGEGFFRRLAIGTTVDRLLGNTSRPMLMVRLAPGAPYRRVLVAVDFSPWSSLALGLARCVAPDAHFVLLSAFEVPFGDKLRYAGVDAERIADFRDEARTTAIERLHAFGHEAGLSPTQWTPCIIEGDASHVIVEQEQLTDCELVVLGKHGRSFTEDLLLGSVTRHVLAEGSRDVLVSMRSTRD